MGKSLKNKNNMKDIFQKKQISVDLEIKIADAKKTNKYYVFKGIDFETFVKKLLKKSNIDTKQFLEKRKQF